MQQTDVYTPSSNDHDDAWRARDGRHGVTLDAWLTFNPDVAFATWITRDGTAVVDLLRIPEGRRRQGLGSRIYRMWEDALPDGMAIELFAVDAEASAFWRSLGFVGEDNSVMRKRVTRMAMAA